MSFLTSAQSAAEIDSWRLPLQDALSKHGIQFTDRATDLEYHGKVGNERFILELPGGVLLVGQPVEEIGDRTIDERYSSRLVVTEVELKRGRVGIGHRQSYGARQNGLPQLKSVIECAQKRLGTTPLINRDKRPKDTIPEIVTDHQPVGVLLHIGSVLVSEQCAREISDLISNDELYRKSPK